MKKIILAFGYIVFFVYFTWCNGDDELPTPNARIVAILNDGGGLRFEWDPVDGADGYRVKVDDGPSPQYEGTNTYFEWTQPAKKIEIVAYAGDKESPPKVFDFTPKSTANVAVYDATDPDPNHPSYIEFVDGVATPRNAQYKAQAWMLFYQDQVSTNVHNNSAVDAGYSEISGDWEGAALAPGAGNYLTVQPAIEGAAYYIWFDFAPIGTMGEEDYFGKMKISAKSGTQYTVSFYFQTHKGLRWLKTQ